MEKKYGKRVMQSKLFEEDYDSQEPKLIVNNNFPISESVRNATYNIIKPHLPECRQRVYEIILQHPEGISNKQIAIEWGVPINSVTGRVTELRQADLVDACGTKPVPDYGGRMHPNTLWRAL